MDRKSSTEAEPGSAMHHSSSKKITLIALGASVIVLTGLYAGYRVGHGQPSRAREGTRVEAEASSDGSTTNFLSPSYWLHTYGQAWLSVQDKVDSLRRADQDRERLKMENAYLRLRLESAQYECQAQSAANQTSQVESIARAETGSPLGRTLASIHYQVPTQLLPSQLYALGVDYFKAREDEKAAAIFTFLGNMEDDHTYQTPRTELMTGVAWYRLDNFAQADAYFARVLARPETGETRPFQAQARLWRAMIQQKQGDHAHAQAWLRELLEHHPHSLEAEWVNGGAKRATASANPGESGPSSITHSSESGPSTVTHLKDDTQEADREPAASK